MPKNAIELHIAEHGLVNAIETLISTPEKLETTEIAAAVRLRIVAQLLTISDEAIETLATSWMPWKLCIAQAPSVVCEEHWRAARLP